MTAVEARQKLGRSDATAPEVDELTAIKEVRRGSAEFFEVLIQRYNQRLFRLARGVLKNDADAEEVVQEAYIQAYLKLDQYSGAGEFAGWLSRIALNEAYQHLRKNARRPIESDAYPQDLVGDVIPPDRLAHSAALRPFIERSIDSLPDEFRIVFVLRVLERFSIAETAEMLSLPENTVKTRQYRATKRLRSELHQAYEQQLSDSFGFAGDRCRKLTLRVMAEIRKIS